jgi:hypothetical protein
MQIKQLNPRRCRSSSLSNEREGSSSSIAFHSSLFPTDKAGGKSGSVNTRRSSIAFRAMKAESASRDGSKLWQIIGVVFTTIVFVYSSCYVIVEFGLFKGSSPSYLTMDSKTACMKSLIDSEFDISEVDNFDLWFDEETILELPTVGIYVGPQDIREYVMFTGSKYFQGKLPRYIYGPDVLPIRTDDRNKCVMLTTYGRKVYMNGNYTRSGVIEVGGGTKIEYSSNPFRVSRIDLYLSDQFQNHVFSTFFDDDRIRDDVCNFMEVGCNEVYQLNNLTQEECYTKWDALPMSEEGWVDGNSKGCRIVHAELAFTDKKHCPHLSFVPMEDQDGNIKCQNSAMRTASDIFTQWEIDKIREAAAEHGLPPDTIYKEFEFEPDGFDEDNNEYKLGGTESFFSSQFSDKSYMTFYGFVLWATMVFTGLGIEYFCYVVLIKDHWSTDTENKWKFAQFLFPLMATTSVGMAHTNNFLAVPLMGK